MGVNFIGVANDVKETNSNLQGRVVVHNICRMLDFEWKVVVRHSYREVNRLTDALTIYNYHLNEMYCCFEACLEDFKYILVADGNGVATP